MSGRNAHARRKEHRVHSTSQSHNMYLRSIESTVKPYWTCNVAPACDKPGRNTGSKHPGAMHAITPSMNRYPRKRRPKKCISPTFNQRYKSLPSARYDTEDRNACVHGPGGSDAGPLGSRFANAPIWMRSLGIPCLLQAKPGNEEPGVDARSGMLGERM
ncbi:hypothetical protein BKA66DRAFT_445832 [Pyrenochaeta sp. MPI-SDFR-AT-0127]|nr:hypothetical protein BKA66DRAFT_445832 [Pyrenochaeta sp. MPI-SDFR-AT-0127]